MENLRIKGKYVDKHAFVDVNLALMSFQEGDSAIIYSPALDLSGYGDNEEEAREAFAIALDEFIRYTLNKKTLKTELENLGWKIISKKSGVSYKLPYFDHLLSTNSYLSDIVREKEFRKFNQKVRIPAYA